MKALLALDGSVESALALETSCTLSWPDGTQLEVLTVLPTETELYGGPWGAGLAYVPDSDLQEHLRADRQALLDEAAARLRSSGLEVRTRLAQGRAATVIVEVAREIGADLVILGARGHGAIEEALLGSVSAEVVDQTHCAVLVARRPTARRVLIGTDGSDVSMSAIAFVGGSHLFDAAETRLIYAIDLNSAWWMGFTPGDASFAVDPYLTVVEQGRRHGEEMTAAAAGTLRSEGLDPSTVVRDGQAAPAIVREAAKWNADLVVVGTRGNGLLKRLLLGSTARSVLHHAAASVLIGRGTSSVTAHSKGSSEPSEQVPA